MKLFIKLVFVLLSLVYCEMPNQTKVNPNNSLITEVKKGNQWKFKEITFHSRYASPQLTNYYDTSIVNIFIDSIWLINNDTLYFKFTEIDSIINDTTFNKPPSFDTFYTKASVSLRNNSYLCKKINGITSIEPANPFNKLIVKLFNDYDNNQFDSCVIRGSIGLDFIYYSTPFKYLLNGENIAGNKKVKKYYHTGNPGYNYLDSTIFINGYGLIFNKNLDAGFSTLITLIRFNETNLDSND
jgi:hypothetical protein